MATNGSKTQSRMIHDSAQRFACHQMDDSRRVTLDSDHKHRIARSAEQAQQERVAAPHDDDAPFAKSKCQEGIHVAQIQPEVADATSVPSKDGRGEQGYVISRGAAAFKCANAMDSDFEIYGYGACETPTDDECTRVT